ncbi:hypothetical protein QWY14_02640 [Planococcus sp. N028]|uniref:Uncharacterized protein n=1 Tax=Planococcus shixiaomingii TaxID=3058393 RepID=A0ABT8MYF9_9BACL|nr:hypothetical protein [Planococcus sp. N028]MDN7240666.1 hypothetical protein [Planococcus sp. N028]
MWKFHWGLIGMLALATFFCVYGQGMAYFLNDHLIKTYPIYYLTGLTTLGILMFLVAALLLVWLFKKKKLSHNSWLFYLAILLLVAPYASAWAFFVTVMWWG